MNCYLRLRPLWRIKTSLPPDQVVERLKELLVAHEADFTGTISDRYVILRIKDSRQHFGSPQLSFEVEAQEEGSELTGLFMPMPSIWTAFMALYGLIVFGGFGAACYGYAQVKIDHTPFAFWGVPGALVLLAIVHLIACIGQRMGQSQMQELQRFVERALAHTDAHSTPRDGVAFEKGLDAMKP